MHLAWFLDFGDTTPLMETALVGAEQDLVEHLANGPCLERNFLGQSVLHLAVLRPNILRRLISCYDNVDHLDKNGTTPLMYAATYDEVESALLLIDHGAEWTIRDGLRQRNFLDYAVARESCDLITTVAKRLKQRLELEEYQCLVDYIMIIYVIRRTHICPENHFQELFSLGVDPNLIFNNGTTLLHHVKTLDEAKLLFQAGFGLINHQDDSGITPLMALVRLGNTALVEECLHNGASVNKQDDQGWTALHHIIQQMGEFPFGSFYFNSPDDWELLQHSETVNTIRLLLEHGADPATADHCVCACSMSGCTPSRILLGKGRSSFSPTTGDLWSLEWLQILSELGSIDTAEEALRNLVQVEQFTKCELTHVCCQRRGYSRIDEDDIDEIVEEENEGIQELDETMRRYSEGRKGTVEERWIEQLQLRHASANESIRGQKTPDRFGPVPIDVSQLSSLLFSFLDPV